MILTGSEILKEIEAGNIDIDPFDVTRLNPNSYDLTLSRQYGVYNSFPLDSRGVNSMIVKTFQELTLLPGTLYLMNTVERTSTTKYAPLIEGKSSIGRLGIEIHKTAGVGDVGFKGVWTLEVQVVHPVKVYAGMPIAQIMFHSVQGEVNMQYKGKYQEASSLEASKMYKEFQ